MIEAAELFAARFRANANSLAMAYGGRLWLVGSTLTSNDPGDIDLRCVITHEDAELMFGADSGPNQGPDWTPGRWRRAREELKQSRRLTRRWKGGAHPSYVRRFDFQFVMCSPPEMFEIGDRPRLRLDTAPDEALNAGRGDP